MRNSVPCAFLLTCIVTTARFTTANLEALHFLASHDLRCGFPSTSVPPRGSLRILNSPALQHVKFDCSPPIELGYSFRCMRLSSSDNLTACESELSPAYSLSGVLRLRGTSNAVASYVARRRSGCFDSFAGVNVLEV
jgi:hypothetical protein